MHYYLWLVVLMVWFASNRRQQLLRCNDMSKPHIDGGTNTQVPKGVGRNDHRRNQTFWPKAFGNPRDEEEEPQSVPKEQHGDAHHQLIFVYLRSDEGPMNAGYQSNRNQEGKNVMSDEISVDFDLHPGRNEAHNEDKY